LPTDLTTLEKLPLKEYQKRASEFGRDGNAGKSIVTLNEAAEFYPYDLPIRQVLISLLERTGRHAEIPKYQGEIMIIQMIGSVAACAIWRHST
jgi:hypothetical protein